MKKLIVSIIFVVFGLFMQSVFAQGTGCFTNADGNLIGTRDDNPTVCSSNADPGEGGFFNNNVTENILSNFASGHGLNFTSINCSQIGADNAADLVREIQQKLQSTQNPDCMTCIDGRFGPDTSAKVTGGDCLPGSDIEEDDDEEGETGGSGTGGNTSTGGNQTATSLGGESEETCDLSTEKKVNGECVCDSNKTCCGIKLNTAVPFIGDCIEMTISNDTDSVDPNKTVVNPLNAFPILVGGLTKILVTVILILSFVGIIAGGVMMATGGLDNNSYAQGKKLIWKVVAGLILLGASGIILRLINPNFFG